MKKRDKWIAVIFMLFIFTLPIVTVVKGFLPQSQEDTLTEEQQKLLNNNGTMQDGSKGDDTSSEQSTADANGQSGEPVKTPWFTALQNSLNSFTERLFGRNKLISFNSELTSLLTGGTYMESTQVLLGKDNWLFYKTEMDGHPLWDYMGINHFTEEELAAIAANLVNMRDGFKELGVDFYVTALPNKEIIYEEYMPDTVARVNEVSRAEQLADYIWDNTDLVYVYPKQALLDAKEEGQIYYKTDTHWNQKGAFVGMQELLHAAYGVEAKDLNSVSFDITSNDLAGDLAVIGGVADKYNIDTTYVFDADTCAVITAIDEQSADIALGVDKALEAKMGEDEIDAIGAGDQGIQFGYASNETEEYMPYAINMAHKLARQLTKIRKDGTLKYLRPDGKTQVTVEYDEAGKPIRIDAVVCSTQHDPDVTQEQIHEDIKKYVFDEIIPADMVDENTKYFINPTGRFVIGGPHGDSGLTGRKIIVDTYGGTGRHGGGAFSGKDCTKVDRSAAYAARYVAKNIVAAGLADKCEIQLSYAIGVAHPTSIHVETFGTGKLSDTKLVEIIRENFDLRPAGIIKMLDLRRPIYRQTAAYGHFGRTDVDLPWEHLDKVDDLKKYLA